MNRGRFGGFKQNRGRQGFNKHRYSEGPPDQITGFELLIDILVIGNFVHSCEGDIVIRSSIEKIPYLNAAIYMENKVAIGKVDEIFGPINDYVSQTLTYSGFQ